MAEVKDKPRAITKDNPGRSFEVVCKAVGPWTFGDVFSEYEFRRIHPAPTLAPGEQGDAEQYWEDLLKRLMTEETLNDGVDLNGKKVVTIIRPKAIAVTDKKPTATRLGPESDPPRKFVSPLAARIQRDVMEGLAAAAR